MLLKLAQNLFHPQAQYYLPLIPSLRILGLMAARQAQLSEPTVQARTGMRAETTTPTSSP